MKQTTAALHARVEASVGLDKRVDTPAAYRRLLERLLGLHAAYEDAFAALDWGGLDVDIARRRKVPLLEADLAALGASPDEIAALPRLRPAPILGDAVAGLGALYVLEGSTLGGKLILKDVSRRLGVTGSHGARFFASYGPRTGAMWRACLAVLATIDPLSPEAARAEAAAMRTFQNFEYWIHESQI